MFIFDGNRFGHLSDAKVFFISPKQLAELCIERIIGGCLDVAIEAATVFFNNVSSKKTFYRKCGNYSFNAVKADFNCFVHD